MSRRVSTRALIAHHLRSRAGGSAIVASLVLVLALVATAAPIALGLLGDAALRDRLESLPATGRDVIADSPFLPVMPETDPFPPTDADDVWADFLAALEGIRRDADAPLPDVLGEARAVASVPGARILEDPATQALTMAFSPGYESEIRVVEGVAPGPAVVADDGSLRVEVVLSRETAQELEWQVGDERHLGSDPVPYVVVLSGVFEPADASSPFWQHSPSVLQPSISDDGNRAREVTGTAFAHPASAATAAVLTSVGIRPATVVWYPTDVDGIDADNAEQTVAALNKLTSVSHTIASSAEGVGILSLKFDADITGEIELALAQQSSTAGVIAMLIAGPIGVAAAVLALGCRLILEGRRSAMRLMSARGASVGQLRRLLGTEGAITGLVPAIVGASAVVVAAALLFGAAPSAAGLVPALLVGVAPVVILVILAPSAGERPMRADLSRRGSRLRLVVEGVLVGITAVALALLFVRGYTAGVDLLLAATPLLLSLVACLVTLRLYPLPLTAVLSRARAGAGADAFLGSARALREPSIGLTPVLALVVGVSVAVSSGILLSALQTGVADASRAQIGADVRVTGGSFTRDQLDRVDAVDGVAGVAGISGAEPATLDIDGVKRATSVFVVDAAELAAVQGDGPGMLPPDLVADAGASLGSGAGAPVPVVVSGATADAIGAADDLRVDGADVIVVGVTRGPVPTGVRENWVVLDSAYAESTLGRDPTDRTVLVALDEGAAPGDVADDLRTILGSAVRIDTSDEIADAIESGPAVQGVRWALLLATAVTALLSALALAMTLTLAAAPRARVLALLRTLGAPPRSATSLALWEIGPPALAAVVAGTVFGALVPLVVLAAVDLRPFTGSSVQPGYGIDPAILLITLGGFLALAALLTAAVLLVSRRARAAGALRTVEEG